jgi:hypothetical protein
MLKLKSIQQKNAKLRSRWIIDGIEMATSIPNKKKVVILLSDGVNNAGVITPEEAIAYAKINKIQVYSIGMGSEGKTILDMTGLEIHNMQSLMKQH